MHNPAHYARELLSEFQACAQKDGVDVAAIELHHHHPIQNLLDMMLDADVTSDVLNHHLFRGAKAHLFLKRWVGLVLGRE